MEFLPVGMFAAVVMAATMRKMAAFRKPTMQDFR